jgi:fucose 4-O-acetylase-like acetyltransferase
MKRKKMENEKKAIEVFIAVMLVVSVVAMTNTVSSIEQRSVIEYEIGKQTLEGPGGPVN